jgi:predicted Fe-Mo cluster-binding NifX family protein
MCFKKLDKLFKKMKIAVPTTHAETVDAHFGHCEFYTLFTFSDQNAIIKTEILPSPQGCGCKSNIASVLREKGVSVLLAGNMGQGAVNVITNQGIRVIRGCEGNINLVVDKYINGSIKDSGETCAQHEEGHTCNHKILF